MSDLKKFQTDGQFLMLALDHRESFKKLMNPDDPESVSDHDAIQLKTEIIQSLQSQFSGLLIDTDYGLPAIQGLRLARPYLLPIEKTGYIERSGGRLTEIERTAAELKQLGAGGAKLLLYFNPNHPSSVQQLETAQRVVADCQAEALPLFLEIVAYGDKPTAKTDLVVTALEKFLAAGIQPDVYKLGYPGSVEACNHITTLLDGRPWILLTAGETFQVFTGQLTAAAQAKVRGFLAGRGIWQEVCQMTGADKAKFLAETLPQRFRQICEILAQP